jgi:PDZ domain
MKNRILTYIGIFLILPISLLAFYSYAKEMLHVLHRPELGMLIDFPWGEDEYPEIIRIDVNGPADKRGLNVGDVIVSINDHEILSRRELDTILQGIRWRDTVRLSLENEDSIDTITLDIASSMTKFECVNVLIHLLVILVSWFLFTICYFKGGFQKDVLLLALVCFAIYCKFCFHNPIKNVIFEINPAEFFKIGISWLKIKIGILLVINALTCSSLFHFLLIFPRTTDLKSTSNPNRLLTFFDWIRHRAWLIYLLPYIPILFFVCGFFVPILNHRHYDSPGLVVNYYIGSFAFIVTLGIIRFLAVYRMDENKLKRSQERIVLFAVLFFSSCYGLQTILLNLSFVNTYVIVLFAYIRSLLPIGYLALLTGFVLAIFRYRLLRVERIVSKTLLNFGMVTFSIVLFTLIENLASQSISRFVEGAEKYVSLASSVMVALVFTPVRNQLDRLIKLKF